MAGAIIGPLVSEDDTADRMKVADMLDVALTLVSFKVVQPAEDGA